MNEKNACDSLQLMLDEDRGWWQRVVLSVISLPIRWPQ